MLVLIAGVTGKLGTLLARAALERGLRVRGLGRHPESLDPTIASQLESFVSSTSYYDIPALDKAVTAVDAVICAYAPEPVLDLEGHLLLLRAAERAGVKIFHASSWNADWRKYSFGEFEHYDTHIAFERHVDITSTIKPVYVFTGVFAELLFCPVGPGCFSKDESGAANIQIWDEGKAIWSWTTMKDAAEFSIKLLMTEEVKEGKGGYFSIKSGESSPYDIARAYETVRGVHVDVKYMGTSGELDEQVSEARRELGASRFREYLPILSQWLGYRGKTQLENAQSVNGESATALEDFLRDHPGM